MMDILNKIVDLLPLPIIVALGFIIAIAWLFKQIYKWDTYGPLLKNRLFLVILIATFVALPLYYFGINYWKDWLLTRSATPEGQVGIWVAKFEGDTDRSVQRTHVEELQVLLSQRAIEDVNFQVRYLDRSISGETLTDRHKKAREIGKQVNAELVLWGDVIGEKLILHITLVNPVLPSQEIDISPILGDFREKEIPFAISRNLGNLSAYIAALSYLGVVEEKRSANEEKLLREKAVEILTDIGRSAKFDYADDKERELAAQTKALEGYLLFESEEYEESREAFKESARLDKRLEPVVNTYLGIIAFNLKEPWVDVLQYFEHGANYWLNWYAMGKLFFNIRELKAAEHAFDKSLEHLPSNPNSYFYKARIYHEWKEIDKAIESMTAAVSYLEKEGQKGGVSKGGPVSLEEAKFYLGTLYDEKGESEQAIEAINASLQLNPDNSFVHNYLATIYLKRGDIESGMKALNAAIEVDPNNHRAYFNLAGAHAELNQFDQAIELYEKAATLQTDYVQPFFQLAKLYTKMELYEKAIESYERALKRIEETWDPNAEATRDISLLLQLELDEVRKKASKVTEP